MASASTIQTGVARGSGPAGERLLATAVLLAGAFAGLVAAKTAVVGSELVHRSDATAIPGACWFHAVTGWSCPMCGLVRSVVANLHGDLATAWTCHPAGLACVLFGAATVTSATWTLCLGTTPIWRRARFSRALSLLGALCVLGGLCRP